MPTTIFTPQMLRNGTRSVPEIPAGGGAPFLNTYSLDFNGVDDYVDCGVISTLQSATEFTMSCWLNSSNITKRQGVLKWYFSVLYWLELSITPTSQLQMVISNGALVWGVSASSIVLSDTWYNVVIIYNGSGATNADRLKIYLNGTDLSLTFTGTIPTNTSTLNGSTFRIGQRYINADYFLGNIDEVSIFDYAISIGEVWDGSGIPSDLSLLATPPTNWYRNGDNGAWKSPQWLIPNNENKDKVSNYSFELDGVDDYVDCGASTLSGETALTISAWVYPTSYGDVTAPSFVSTDWSPRGFYLGVYYSTNFRFSLSTNGTNLNSLDTAAGTVDLNTWQHILVTWDKVNTKFYKNGVLLKTVATNYANNQDFTTTNDLLIGARRSNAGFFNGNIDEVSIFDYALTQQNVTDIYNGGTPTDLSLLATPPINYYKMGEEATFSGGVWTVPDSVGSNNGTSNAMTIDDRVGEAPNSSNNALSFNMDEVDRTTDVPT